jgi:hypothetical protein
MDREFAMRRWAVVVLALLAAVAIGTIAYQAGVAHGIALQPPAAAAPAAPGGAQTAPAPYYAYRYYGPWRFGFFGPLFGILFFIFLMRLLFWGLFGFGMGGAWRRRSWYYDHPDDGPSRFDDWHRRAHERMRDDRAPASPNA